MTDSVRKYQARAFLVVDGIAGPLTRACQSADNCRDRVPVCLPQFGPLITGEGFRPEPYVPSDESGVTIGIGYDLRYHSAEESLGIFSGMWWDDRLFDACGLYGPEARAWLEDARSRGLRWVITPEEMGARLPSICRPYWAKVQSLWDGIDDAPEPVRAVALSAVYSAWSAPIRDMARAAEPDWGAVARAVAKSKGDPKRRSREAQCILGALAVR